MSFGFGFGFPKRLTSGGGLSPRLYLDFVGTGVLPSTVTFSRGTNATLTGSNGLIQWAPHNLLTNSESFEAAAWTKSNATVIANAAVAPDGTTTADKLIPTLSATDARASQALTGTAGITYTLSVYAKAAEFNQTRVYADDGSSNIASVFYNLTTGTITSGPTTSGTWTGAATTSTDVGSGWWRITLTWMATGAAPTRYQVRCTNAGDGTSGIFIWGAQLNIGSTAQSYNSTTPKNLLGFTQEPENAAWTKSNSYVQQNLLTWSQDFDNAAWTKIDATVTANAAVAPDGTTTADSIQRNNVGDTAVYQGAVVASLTTYTASVYVKANSVGFAVMQFVITGAGAYYYLNLSTGAISQAIATYGATPPTNLSATVSSSGNGWFRATFTGTIPSGVTAMQLYCKPISTGTGPGFESVNNGQSIYAWGAQLVQGSTAGDYTQTTSAAAPTRYLNWDGTLTGRKLVETTANSAHYVSSPVATITAGTPLTASVYAKLDLGRNIEVRLTSNNGTFTYSLIVVSLVNGSTVTTAGNATSKVNTVTPVGNGWYRISVSAVLASDVTLAAVWCGLWDGTNATYTGDGTSGIYVSDFQLSNSASVDPYVYNPQAAAASAAYYGPRFDYDPVTLAAKGLLIEEQRTNLLTYSEQFNNAAWVKNAVTVSANTATAPDGTVSADVLTSSGDGRVTGTATASANTAYTGSVWLRVQSGTLNVTLFRTDNGTGFSSTPVTVTTTWQRFTATATTSATATAAIFQIGGGGSFPNGSVLEIWGAQLEAGSFATSYIPTVASQVTRNADSASMLGDNFYTWYNPNQGTVSAESLIGSKSPSSYGIYAVDDGTTNNAFPSFYTSTVNANSRVSAANVFTSVSSSLSATPATFKQAFAYAPANYASAFNGAAPTTQASGAIPGGLIRLQLGSYNSFALNGHIRRIGYYNTRLPDSTLQALTTT